MQIVWTPYDRSVYQPKDYSWYDGGLICFDTIEPHCPMRVLRQYGRVQVVPKMPPKASLTKRTDRNMQYAIIQRQAQQWQSHVLAERLRSVPVRDPWDCNEEYLDWYLRVSHPHVQNPAHRRSAPLRNVGRMSNDVVMNHQ